MAWTSNQKIILSGTPFAWVHKITSGAISALWQFENLASSSYKITKPGSESGGENIDITRADGAIIRFPKKSLIIDGKDGADITPADASSDATGKGEITLVINEAAKTSTSWTSFLKDIKTNFDSLFLVTIGTGYTYNQSVSAGRAPDGYVHMIGKINTDVEQTLDSNPATVSLTFVSYGNSGLDASDLSGAVFADLTLNLGGTGKDVESIKPASISAGDATILLDGDILIVPASA